MVTDPLHPALRAVSDAVLAVASEHSVEEVLQRLVDVARELAGAPYSALGIPDGEGGFSAFLVSGMSDELIAAMGPLPRTHGLLGAMLETAKPYRSQDIHDHPRFRGWWPREHPDMRSFLGVPINAPQGVIGAFYLTDKPGGFTDADQALIELLASHAAIAISNARLLDQSRELSMLEERNRLARELHDVVSQKLFGVVLTAETAGTLLERGNTTDAGERVARTAELARQALDELRVLILELRPPDLAADGLDGALRKHVEVLRRVHPGVPIDLRADHVEPDLRRDRELLRIAQEALQNALRHATPTHIDVALARDPLALTITDDGCGFDPSDTELRARRLGLTSMEERARRIGATLSIASTDAGTTVTVR